LGFLFDFTYKPQFGQARWESVGALQLGHAEICTFLSASWERRLPTFDLE